MLFPRPYTPHSVQTVCCDCAGVQVDTTGRISSRISDVCLLSYMPENVPLSSLKGSFLIPQVAHPDASPSRGPIFKPWSVLRCHTVMLSSLLLPRRPSSSTHMPRVRRRKQPAYKRRRGPAVAGMQPILMSIQSFEEARFNVSTSLKTTWTYLWATLSDSDVNNVIKNITSAMDKWMDK